MKLRKVLSVLFASAMVMGMMSISVFAENDVAKIGAVGYPSLKAAVDAAVAGDEIVLLTDDTASAIITVDEAITIDGGNNTLTSSAGRAINVNVQGNVVIKNLEIVGTGSCQRGINIINESVAKVANVALDNVTISGVSHYAVHVATSAAAGTTVDINACNLTGYAAVAVYGDDRTITVNNSTLVGINTYHGSTDSFATFAVGGSDIAVNVTGGSITAESKEGCEAQCAIGAIAGSTSGLEAVLDTEIILVGDEVGYVGMDPETNSIAVRAEYAAAISQDGYVAGTPADGLVQVKKAVAKCNGTTYATLQEAINGASAGDVIEVVADSEASAIVTIDKAITIDGGNNTLTSSAGRAINVDVQGDVVIKNLEIVGTGSCERGVNVIQKKVNLTLDNVTISGVTHYPVNVASSAPAGTAIAINKCSLTSYGALNITGNGRTITVTDSTLVGINTYKGETNSYTTVAFDGDDIDITITGGSIKAESKEGCEAQYAIGAVAGSTSGLEAVLDTEIILVGEKAGYVGIELENNSVAVRAEYAAAISQDGYATGTPSDGLVQVKKGVAKCNGTTYATLQEAIAAANGDVVLVDDIALNEKLVINDEVTIDLNGKSLTLADDAVVGYNYALVVKGELTIKDTSAEKSGEVNVIGSYGIGTSTTCTGGINIEGGTFNAADGNHYLIGVYAGEINISGGVFNAYECAVNNFSGYTGTVVITDGEFTSSAVNQYAYTILGKEIEISGGTYESASGHTFGCDDTVVITGGTFDEDVSEYCADGFEVVANGDGTYGIVAEAAQFITETDGGQYDGGEIGAIAFNSKYLGFDAEADITYGMYIYTEGADKGVKLEGGATLTQEWFSAVVDEIPSANFDTPILCIPYVTVAGNTVFGDVTTATVNDFTKVFAAK